LFYPRKTIAGDLPQPATPLGGATFWKMENHCAAGNGGFASLLATAEEADKDQERDWNNPQRPEHEDDQNPQFARGNL